MSSSPNSSSSEGLVASSIVPLHGVVCRLDIVLGTATMSVRDCLGLEPGSIITLAQPVGEDVQLVVNNVVLAEGEVVIVDEGTAVRVTNIVQAPGGDDLT